MRPTGVIEGNGRSGGQASFAAVLSPSRMGDVNRSRVLQALCDVGPLTRAELARLAGVPRATISGIVRPLLESGLLEEGAPDRSVSRVGKPGRPLWFRSGAGLSGAVALRGDGCEAALVSARGEIVAHHQTELSDARDLAAVHRDVAGCLERALGSRRGEILGIGVAVPGVCDTTAGVVVASSQIPALTGHELGPELEREVGVKVVIDNDSRAQALGEKWFGEGRGFQHFAAIQTGHGLGAGLVLGGQVFRGADGRVGEIGHIPVGGFGGVARPGKRTSPSPKASGPPEEDGQGICACGLRGCWETIATLPWVRAEARVAKLPGAASLDARGLTRLVDGGSAPARDLLDRYAANLATGLAALVQLVNPDRIILHGDAVGGGEPFRELIAEHVRARSLPPLRAGLDLVLSKLDQQAGLLGAAGLVLSETFNLAT